MDSNAARIMGRLVIFHMTAENKQRMWYIFLQGRENVYS